LNDDAIKPIWMESAALENANMDEICNGYVNAVRIHHFIADDVDLQFR
jgi:hypothetical protein